MSNLLVSFPNVFPYGLALGSYDFDTGNFRWIDLAQADRPLLGVSGTCRCGDNYWVLPQLAFGGISGLTRLDLDLHSTRHYPLVQTRDAHSLIADGAGFLVADTGANGLNLVRLGEDGQVYEEEFWRACQGDEDLVHLNSVARLDGDLHVSVLGPRPEEGWSDAQGGKIINITRSQVVCGDLHHPHTLVAHEGALYWLESRRSRVHRYSRCGGHEVLLELQGYLRGLTFDERFMYVGASALRRHSRSTGAANTYPSATADDWQSWIYRVDRTTLEVGRRKMTAFGEEIYELTRAQAATPRPHWSDREEAVVDRLWRYEDTYWQCVALHKEQVQVWQNEVAAVQGRFSSLQQQVSDAQQQVADAQRQVLGLKNEVAAVQGRFSGLQQQVSDSQRQVADAQRQVLGLKSELERVYNCRRWRWAGRILGPLERLGLLPRRPAPQEQVSLVR